MHLKPARHSNFFFYGFAYTFAITMMATTMPTPLYPTYLQAYNLSALTISIIYATYSAGVLSILLFIGTWSDRIGRRPVLLAGVIFSLTSSITFINAHSLSLLLLARFFSGVSAGVFTSIATVALIELAPASKHSKATFVATAANMGGLGVGPPLAAFLASYLPAPLQLTFFFHIALALAGLIILFKAPETVKQPQPFKFLFHFPKLPKSMLPVFIPASIAALAAFAVLGMFSAIAPLFLIDVLGVNGYLWAGLTVFLIFMASIVGQGLQGHINPRLQLAIGCCTLVLGMAFIILSLAQVSLMPLLMGSVIAGIGHGIIFRTGLIEITRASPDQHRAEITSCFFLVTYIAVSVPVIGLGLLSQITTLQVAGITFSGVVAIAAAIATLSVIWREFWLRN